jgi:hypothetical protein
VRNAIGSGRGGRAGDQWEAFDALAAPVRKALQESLNDYSATDVLAYSREHGWKAAVEWLRYGDRLLVDKGWRIERKVGVKNHPSPAKACRVSILRANW